MYNSIQYFVEKVIPQIEEKREKFKQGSSACPRQKKKIKVRIDVKNYNGVISKPVAQKFVDDCKKNPQVAEHWLVGGERLTKGANDVMDNSEHVCRYYNQEAMNKVDNYYQNQLDNINLNDNDIDE